MEFLDFRKCPLNYYLSNTRGGLFYVSRCGIHLLLGFPLLGRWKAWTICVFSGRCLDLSCVDSLFGR
jgi:hypothetical protein